MIWPVYFFSIISLFVFLLRSHGKEKLGDEPDFAKASYYFNPITDKWVMIFFGYIFVIWAIKHQNPVTNLSFH